MKVIFIINSILSLLFGLAFVFLPGQLLSIYGITLGDAGLYIGQLFGAAILGYAVLAWFARNTEESPARRAILIALFTGFTIGFIMALIGQLTGVVNAVGWSTVAIYLFFAVAFGYLRFMKSSSS